MAKIGHLTVLRGTGIYIVHSDHFPPPSFEINFFPPTNKFEAGGRGCRGGSEDLPANFFEFIAQKDAFLRPLKGYILCI